MLHVTFKVPEPNKYIWSNNDVFSGINYEDYLIDKYVVNIVEDIDKSKILSCSCIESPILGQISPLQLSGGTKGLILIYSGLFKEYFYLSSKFGNNCYKWIVDMAKSKDVYMYWNSTVCVDEEYLNGLTLHLIDTNTFVNNPTDILKCMIAGVALEGSYD